MDGRVIAYRKVKNTIFSVNADAVTSKNEVAMDESPSANASMSMTGRMNPMVIRQRKGSVWQAVCQAR